MNQAEFNMCRDKLDQLCKEIVAAKRPEYTEGSGDVLFNFKTVAEELGITPDMVLYVYYRKHVASIGQFCATRRRVSSEPIEKRIADARNYLDLLYALVCEERKDFGNGAS